MPVVLITMSCQVTKVDFSFLMYQGNSHVHTSKRLVTVGVAVYIGWACLQNRAIRADPYIKLESPI